MKYKASISYESSHGMLTTTTWSVLDSICIALCVSVVAIHSYGIFLFIKITRTNFDARNNNIEIISLSVSTIVLAVVYITHVFVTSFRPSIEIYSTILIYAASLPFYGSLIMLTLQRFFALYFHLRYQSSMVYRKRRYLMLTFYVAALVLGVIEGMIYLLGGNKEVVIYIEKSFSVAALFATNVIFIVVYVYIFIKYRRASRLEKRSLYRPKRNAFFTPIIVYVSLLAFGTLPYMFHNLVQGIQYVIIWFCLDSFSNSIVYLVLHPTIRAGRLAANRRRINVVDSNNDSCKKTISSSTTHTSERTVNTL